jgi:hypothetical protein
MASGEMDRVEGPRKSGKDLAPAERQRATRGALERSWTRHRLIRDMALEEKTGAELARIYGVSPAAISLFKKRHLHEVEEIRENLADEYAGVWVARKLERIRSYQDAAEKMSSGESPRQAEVLVGILKAVAEELGDLPARQQVTVNTADVTYQILAVDIEDLQ